MADEQPQTEQPPLAAVEQQPQPEPTEAEKAAAEALDKKKAVLQRLMADAGAPKRHSLKPGPEVSDFEGDPKEVQAILSQLHAQGYTQPVVNDKAEEDKVSHAHQLTSSGLEHARELGLEEKPKSEEPPKAEEPPPANPS